MPRYMITYLGMPRPATPEEGKAHMEKYMAWLADLGEAAISRRSMARSVSYGTT